MHLRITILSCLILSSCALTETVAPSEEVKQPTPSYWNDTPIEDLVDPRSCQGSYTPPKTVGGLIDLQGRIEFPEDGNKYSQRITAAFFVTKEGKPEKIWFPYHGPSIATIAVRDAVLSSEFQPASCNGEQGLSKLAITVYAEN